MNPTKADIAAAAQIARQCFHPSDYFDETKAAAIIARHMEPERAARRAAVGALVVAIETINVWHGDDEAWEIYYSNAPEMKPIRTALSLNSQLDKDSTP